MDLGFTSTVDNSTSGPILQFAARNGLVVTMLGFIEIDDVPDGIKVIGLDVFVLEIEGVLPDVDADDRHMGKKRVLIRSRDYRQSLGFVIDTKPTPSRALNPSGGRVELADEVFKASISCQNGLFEMSVLQLTTGTTLFGRGSEVLPEKRVVDMPSAVELDSGLKSNTFLRGGGQCVRFLGGVKGVDVGLVVFCVMKGHDLLRDVGLESLVGIWERRECVLHFVFSFC